MATRSTFPLRLGGACICLTLAIAGVGLAAVAGADRWRAMGSAGIRPKGDDHVTVHGPAGSSDGVGRLAKWAMRV